MSLLGSIIVGCGVLFVTLVKCPVILVWIYSEVVKWYLDIDCKWAILVFPAILVGLALVPIAWGAAVVLIGSGGFFYGLRAGWAAHEGGGLAKGFEFMWETIKEADEESENWAFGLEIFKLKVCVRCMPRISCGCCNRASLASSDSKTIPDPSISDPETGSSAA